MNKICEKLFTSSRFPVDHDSGVRPRDVNSQLHRPANCRSLTNDLTGALMKLGLQPHNFCRELIAFQCRTDLVTDPFDQGNVVVGKGLVPAPNKSEQPKSLAADTNGRYQRRSAFKL